MGIRAFLAGRLGRRAPEVTVRAGACELRVRVLHAGTRSEGRVGRLYVDGVEVHGRSAGDVVEADGRRFVFLGHERPHLWSTSGWAEDAPPPEAAGPGATPAPAP